MALPVQGSCGKEQGGELAVLALLKRGEGWNSAPSTNGSFHLRVSSQSLSRSVALLSLSSLSPLFSAPSSAAPTLHLAPLLFLLAGLSQLASPQ